MSSRRSSAGVWLSLAVLKHLRICKEELATPQAPLCPA